jgi:hypothetical protein
MRETFLIGFAVFIGVAGAVISALPAIAWLRRHRRRKALLASFLHAVWERQLRAKRFTCEDAIDGPGFVHLLTATAGTTPFRLIRRFRPFTKADPYWLQLEGETFVFSLRTGADEPHPIVDAYLDLRRQLRREPLPPEVS